MGLVINLSENLDTHAVEQSLAAAPRHTKLRAAATEIIAAVHGLPEVMGAELKQIEVYVGRAGATATLLRNRWSHRYKAFGEKPSTVALVVFQAPTRSVQNGQWERAAQLMIGSLRRAGALCCSNALTGESGRWPAAVNCAIYIVARKRKGPKGSALDERAISAAVNELLEEQSLRADVVRAAALEIRRPNDGTEHELYADDEYDDSDEDDDDEPLCRNPDCTSRAYPSNYGYCRRHRVYVGPGERPCRTCGRPARVGNYGYCGRHRR